MSSAAELARPAAACGVRSAAGMLALQRTAGNAAAVRALGLQRRPRSRLLQRAPLHRVMPTGHNLFYGQNNQHGYTVKPAVNHGIPEGYHVTIYPALTSAQSVAAFSGSKLGELPDYQSIQFTRFNVTSENTRRAHYYFDDQGNVVWARRRRRRRSRTLTGTTPSRRRWRSTRPPVWG